MVGALTLVLVAAIGVASLRLHCLGARLGLRYAGPTRIRCEAGYEKGQELGWFEQGSTIIALASGDLALADGVREGRTLRVGQPLLMTSNARPHERSGRAGGAAGLETAAAGA